MSELTGEYAAEGLVVLAINSWDEDPASLRRFARESKLKHRILLDGSEVAERYGVGSSVPRLFWIDRSGVIVDSEASFQGLSAMRSKTVRLVRSNG